MSSMKLTAPISAGAIGRTRARRTLRSQTPRGAPVHSRSRACTPPYLCRSTQIADQLCSTGMHCYTACEGARMLRLEELNTSLAGECKEATGVACACGAGGAGNVGAALARARPCPSCPQWTCRPV